MKKLYSTLIILVGLFICIGNVNANTYVLDNASVDNLFSNATEVNLSSFLASENALNIAGSTTLLSSDKNAVAAAVLAFFLGGFAVHRYYIGTKGTMFFYYFCTCGGIFGVVPFIDFIMLLIDNKDISKYCNNENFIMW